MARIKGPKKTNRYPDEFKVKAVLLANQPVIRVRQHYLTEDRNGRLRLRGQVFQSH